MRSPFQSMTSHEDSHSCTARQGLPGFHCGPGWSGGARVSATAQLDLHTKAGVVMGPSRAPTGTSPARSSTRHSAQPLGAARPRRLLFGILQACQSGRQFRM